MRRGTWQSWNRTIAACLFSIAFALVAGLFTSVVVEAQRSAAATVFEGASHRRRRQRAHRRFRIPR